MDGTESDSTSRRERFETPRRTGPTLAGMYRAPLLASLLAILSCGSDGNAAIDATGPYPVGFQSFELTYARAATGEERTIEVNVWYPAAEAGDGMSYRVGGVVSVPTEGADQGLGVAAGSFPVAVYSHGNGGVGLLAYPYGEHLASHGWIVVAPDHTGNTALDFLGGGADPFVRSSLDRPNDLSAVLDWVDEASTEVAAAGDTGQTLVFGHSFGGYTTLALAGATPTLERLARGGCPDPENPSCALLDDPAVQAAFEAGFADPRVDAIVPQAPAIGSLDPASITALDLPVMLQSGRLDRTTTQETSAEPTWAALDGTQDLWVEMPRGGHFTFLSICDDLSPELLEAFQPDAPDDGCNEEFIPAADALPALEAYVLGWGRLHVLGETELAEVVAEPLADGFVLTSP